MIGGNKNTLLLIYIINEFAFIDGIQVFSIVKSKSSEQHIALYVETQLTLNRYKNITFGVE